LADMEGARHSPEHRRSGSTRGGTAVASRIRSAPLSVELPADRGNDGVDVVEHGLSCSESTEGRKADLQVRAGRHADDAVPDDGDLLALVDVGPDRHQVRPVMAVVDGP